MLVTGAGSGIGLAQAVAFLEAGHSVLGFDINHDENVNTLLAVYPDRFNFYQVDVTQPKEFQPLLDRWLIEYKYLNVLCNTAGILDNYQPLDQTTLETWEYVMHTNVTSQFIVTKICLPYLIASKASRVVNMASIASLTAGGGGISYTASKHAIAGFTKQLAYDYADQGLRANAIAPGAINTPMNSLDFIENDGQMAHEVAAQTPTKRWADASEVAALTLFLASDAADYMQGNIIPLDGGWLIR